MDWQSRRPLGRSNLSTRRPAKFAVRLSAPRMMFSSPIPRATQPRFNEGANVRGVSARDDRNNTRQWTKNKIVSSQSAIDGRALALLQSRVAQLGKRQIGYLNPSQLNAFSIYAIGNGYQIRDGIVSFRSKYSYYENSDSSLYAGIGNYEYPLYCPNTDGETPDGLTSAYQFFGYDFNAQPTQNSTPVILDTGGAVTPINPGSIILIPSGALGGSADFLAVFWVVITDSNATGLSVQLNGQLVNATASSPENILTPTYPAGANIILVGWVEVSSVNGIKIQQYQFGNLTNRYLPQVLNGASAGFSPSAYRGYWTADALSGQVFYPGDIVSDDSASLVTISGSIFYGTYIWTGAPAAVSSSPKTTAASWKQISAAIGI